MKTIWKFPINVVDEQIIVTPEHPWFLCVQLQRGNPFIWALVNPDNPPVSMRIKIFGTGHPIEATNGLNYIGTFQLHDGVFVGHVFGAV
jgi:hypothetical protein